MDVMMTKYRHNKLKLLVLTVFLIVLWPLDAQYNLQNGVKHYFRSIQVEQLVNVRKNNKQMRNITKETNGYFSIIRDKMDLVYTWEEKQYIHKIQIESATEYSKTVVYIGKDVLNNSHRFYYNYSNRKCRWIMVEWPTGKISRTEFTLK